MLFRLSYRVPYVIMYRMTIKINHAEVMHTKWKCLKDNKSLSENCHIQFYAGSRLMNTIVRSTIKLNTMDLYYIFNIQESFWSLVPVY